LFSCLALLLVVVCYDSSDFKILKGKRALDIVSKCFLNVDGGGHDTHRHGVADLTNFMPFFAQCDRHNFIPEYTHKRHISASVQALFPPGRFTSLSVVVIPYPRKSGKAVSTQSHGLFIKVFKKLEKAGFDIMSISSSVLDATMAACCQEHVLLSQASYGCSYESNQSQAKEWFDALVGQSVLSVVVAGNSALLRLLPVIGPFDTLLAQEKYPLSISATLHAPSTATTLASHKDCCHSVRIFQSSTVAATDMMLKMFAGHEYSTTDLLRAQSQQQQQQQAPSSAGGSTGGAKNLLSDFGSMEYHTYRERYDSPPKPSTASFFSPGGGGSSGGGVEPAVFGGLRQASLAGHQAWLARQDLASYTISKPSLPPIICHLL
jgi:hypothetical protein